MKVEEDKIKGRKDGKGNKDRKMEAERGRKN